VILRNKIALLIFLSLPWTVSFAQVHDAGLWLGAEGSFRLNPLWNVVASGELRMHENMMEPGFFMAEAGVEYALSKSWRVSAGYRFGLKQQLDRSYVLRNRAFADLRYKQRISVFDLSARLKYQQQDDEGFALAGFQTTDQCLRSALELQWRYSRTFRPYLGVEMFNPMIALQVQYPEKYRFKVGLNWQINKIHSLDFGWMYQQEVNVKNPEYDYILAVGYKFSPRF
jgi:hypothetical protein